MKSYSSLAVLFTNAVPV